MICYEFKGGIGTSSRQLSPLPRPNLHDRRAGARRITGYGGNCWSAGVPVGRELSHGQQYGEKEAGSIIIVVATDAPLLPHQLKRLARRAALGLARTGSTSGNGSGDLFVAFSTSKVDRGKQGENPRVEMLYE